MEYEDRLKQMEEKHRHELQEIENEYQVPNARTEPHKRTHAGAHITSTLPRLVFFRLCRGKVAAISHVWHPVHA
jgi:hypothetical protein